jgi:hypothetical protein
MERRLPKGREAVPRVRQGVGQLRGARSGPAVGKAWRPQVAVVDPLTVCTACESVSHTPPRDRTWVPQHEHAGMEWGGHVRGGLGGSSGGVMSALRIGFVSGMCLTAPLLLTGCNAILWGNLGVLCVTVGIFLGTVFLSRSTSATRSAARSTPSTAAPSVAPPA